MIGWALKKLFGTKNQREVTRLRGLVGPINEIETSYQALSDDRLRAKTQEFKDRVAAGESLDALLPEAFAAVKNACRRFTEQKRVILVRGHEVRWEMIPFDVQLIGGMVLHSGRIAEMGTGEGKTLVATLPTYLNALAGRGVHVVTVNDYLAARDAEWMGEVYRFLGLTVGCIQREMRPPERREAYHCDITYGTNSEFGFDYLRDNGMATTAETQVQRGHFYAIIDEVDSILIDEARVPLIIAGPATVQTNLPFDKYKPLLERLVRKQNELVSEYAAEAKKLCEEGDLEGAGSALYRVKIGMPRHRQLLKMMEEPEVRRALEDFELSLYVDTRREELYRIKEDLYFAITEKEQTADLTSKGREFMSPDNPDLFVVPDLLSQLHDINNSGRSREESEAEIRKSQQAFDDATTRIHAISQLLRAYCVFERDVHYVVQDNKVIIVDEFTGRALPGRRWSDGLHAAVEAKEGVQIDRETQTLATITIQNYFRMYQKLAGMTGTAETEANEFHDIYRLQVVVIPPNRPCVREDRNDSVFKTRRAKLAALIRDIKDSHTRGQPLLVGTASVQSSEVISRMLKRENIPHSVLNAKYHQQEAEIVARAGQRGAVTIATNMAGRGTDIKLGEGVSELGGLFVVGTERHESRRIDRQLRGRCARQGDPGQSKFYLSFEDDLIRNFGDSRKLAALMTRLGMSDDEELEHPWLNKSVENAQRRVEERNYSYRRITLQYDDVMNQQRSVVYDFRNEILHTETPREMLFDVVKEVIENRARQAIESDPETRHEALDQLASWMNLTFPVNLETKEIESFKESGPLTQRLLQAVTEAYNLKIQFDDPAATLALERYTVLGALDRLWQEHLYNMDSLRTSIGLRGYGQRDPLVEYKREAYQLFQDLMENVKNEIAHSVFRSMSSIQAFERFLQSLPSKAIHASLPGAFQPPPAQTTGEDEPVVTSSTGGTSFTASSESSSDEAAELIAQAAAPVRRQLPKVGRNEPCPCGSGKKFKNCCGRNI